MLLSEDFVVESFAGFFYQAKNHEDLTTFIYSPPNGGWVESVFFSISQYTIKIITCQTLFNMLK